MKNNFKKNRKKILINIFSIILIGIFLSFGYSWFHSSDQATNSFKGTQLLAEIDEVFSVNSSWKPHSSTVKEVRIRNTGEATSFVRISLYEYLLTFQTDETDQTGNGDLKTSENKILPDAQIDDMSTWNAAAKNHSTLTAGEKNYIVESAIVPDPIARIGMYEYKGIDREKTPLGYLTLNFSSSLIDVVPNQLQNKWVYEKGYFYYLSPLEPGKETEALLESLSISAEYPNKYKGALYKLSVYMDAHDKTKVLKDDWDLDINGMVYPLIKDQLE